MSIVPVTANTAPTGITPSNAKDYYAVEASGAGFIGQKLSPPVPTIHTAATDPIVLSSYEGLTIINKTVGAATAITLPAAPVANEPHTIVDGKGDAGTNNITINGNGKTINGAASKVISSNYGFLSIVYNGTQWNIDGIDLTSTIAGLGSDDIANDSGVAGADVSAALDQLATNLLAAVAGIDIKPSVQAATAGALAAYTRVGNVITADAVGALGNIDAVAVAQGQLILLKNGASGIDNGIYIITTFGDGGTAFVLTRIPEMLGGGNASGAVCFVEAGTVNGGLWGVCTNAAATATVNTDALTFSMISLAGLTAATPAAVAAVAAVGTGTKAARDDHVHALPTTMKAIRHIQQTITHADLTDADTEEDEAIAGVPANVFTLASWGQLVTEFSGGAVASCTVSMGDAAGPTELCTAVNIFTGAGAGKKFAAGAAHGLWTFEAAYALIARFTTTVGNCADLTAGEIVVHVLYVELD